MRNFYTASYERARTHKWVAKAPEILLDRWKFKLFTTSGGLDRRWHVRVRVRKYKRTCRYAGCVWTTKYFKFVAFALDIDSDMNRERERRTKNRRTSTFKNCFVVWIARASAFMMPDPQLLQGLWTDYATGTIRHNSAEIAQMTRRRVPKVTSLHHTVLGLCVVHCTTLLMRS